MSREHPSPLKAIRLHCLTCCCDLPNEVRLCGAVNCNSYPLRLGKSVAGLRPLAVIKNHCAECNGDSGHARDCELESCALHPFRNGHNPNRAGMGMAGGNSANLRKKARTQDAMQARTPCGMSLCTCKTPCAECACLNQPEFKLPDWPEVDAFAKEMEASHAAALQGEGVLK